MRRPPTGEFQYLASCMSSLQREWSVRWTFDNELSGYFERLFAQRCQRLALLGTVPGLRLLRALPLRNAKALGRVADQGNDPSGSDDTGDTAGRPDPRLSLREIRSQRRGVDQFALGDDVGFRLGLSVQPLHGRCAERSTGNDSQHDLVVCIHGAFLSVGWIRHQTACWSSAIMRLASVVTRDRKRCRSLRLRPPTALRLLNRPNG